MATTLFTDPLSGHETLLVEPAEGPRVGTSCDPRRSDLPLAWHVECRHCEQMRWKTNFSIEEKREILIARCRAAGYVPAHGVASHKYLVPTNCHPHVVRAWQLADGTRCASIRGKDPRKILKVTQIGTSPLEYVGNLRNFRAIETSLRRYIRFIFSAQQISGSELESRLRPLADHQIARGTYRGYHKTCDMIDWSSVLTQELGRQP